MKHLLWLAILLALPAAGQTINPSQIRPCAVNGDVLATEGGVTSCASVVAGNGFINVNTYPGSDLGAQFTAAQTANPGAHNFVITGTGVISTAITINSGSNLYIYAPITSVSNVITLANNNAVICSGPTAPITVTTANDLFTSGASNTNSLIQNCYATFSGSGAGRSFVNLVPSTTLSYFSMVGNNITGGNGFVGNNASSVNNSIFTDNTVQDRPAGFGIYLNSVAAINNVVSNNVFNNVGEGFEDIGGNAASFPSLATIIAAGHQNNTAVGNSCANNGSSCVFVAFAYLDVISGNTSNVCGDTCFDLEGVANTVVGNNTATGCGNFCYSQFFSAYGNLFEGNVASQNGGAVFAIKNSSDNPAYVYFTQIKNNDFYCTSATTLCGINLENNSASVVSGNTFVNVEVNFTSDEHQQFTFTNNEINYGVAFGSASPGLLIATSLNDFPTKVSGNRITSYVTQPSGSYCIQVVGTDSNNIEDYFVEHNDCKGWPSGIEVTNNNSNAFSFYAFVRYNTGLASTTITANGSSSVPPVVIATDNCAYNNPVCPTYITVGTIDNTVIGGTTPAAGSFTSVKDTGLTSAPCVSTNSSGTLTSGCSGTSGISGLTSGYIPLAGSATTITSSSHVDDGATTSGLITATEPIAIPSFAGTSTVSSYTLGASSVVGSGATVACTTNYVCDEISGTITLTTGTGTISGVGQLVELTFSSGRAHYPSCTYTAIVLGNPVQVGGQALSTSAIAFYSAVTNLSTSTSYQMSYVCGGK